jgi:hypothetical protein
MAKSIMQRLRTFGRRIHDRVPVVMDWIREQNQDVSFDTRHNISDITVSSKSTTASCDFAVLLVVINEARVTAAGLIQK